MHQAPPRILALLGPTAVGKTALSLKVAEELDAEIISADSRQIYKLLTIGTAKPSREELARVPHHFIDELDLETPYSAGSFARQASKRIRRILNRRRVPLVVGGATLYLQALLHGIAEIPPVEKSVREELERRLKAEGKEALFIELMRYDPATARKLDATKTQRVIRALEVLLQTGRPISSYFRNKENVEFTYTVKVLTRNRSCLYQRINTRVDEMLHAGLLDEVRTITAKGYSRSLPALRSIGYQEAFAHLSGEICRDEMVRLIKRNTRRYAKRQLTWFRRYDPFHWVDLSALRLAQACSWHEAGA